ncbi:hydrogenase nickel incorporation protein HypB [Solimonas variicoloris]|uniref:hydrogenase nickel incorporation protein HypB n=1 Tax=Solimonas variicoloris TaxID=254408 RepID=UPI0003A35C24|nr:hydrogenase nickel incorporation protein HypB [Solimonas variicoloris]
MCVVCGCHQRPLSPAGAAPPAALDGLSFVAEAPAAVVAAPAAAPRDLHYGRNPAGVSVPGLDAERAIHLETRVLAANDRVAAANRQAFAQRGVLCLNLVSSPGSGKTTLLVETIRRLQADGRLRAAVIEGDQQTTNDADRIRATGAPAVQVNTGKGCHLDAEMIAEAWRGLEGGAPQLLFVENVGNLVCPAMWDLGEAAKVAILSVTEGEDKPLKYPDMFAAAQLMLLNKCDLLPHLRFDVAAALAAARRVNPDIEIIELSAFGGEGFERWLQWLAARQAAV